MKRQRINLLLIVQRAYGDAVIVNSIIESIDDNNFYNIDVLTKTQFSSIFKTNRNINKIHEGNFPITVHKSFNIWKQMKLISKIRQEKYDIVMDYIGDFRERIIGFFCGGHKFMSVLRNDKNFNQLIRGGLSFLSDSLIKIDCKEKNIYEQLIFMFGTIGIKIKRKNLECNSKLIVNVGIHPFASQNCRLWDVNNWYDLILELLRMRKMITVFCSPEEVKIVQNKFSGFLTNHNFSISAGSIDNFFLNLKKMDVLIGLDSLSIHAAYLCGVPNIMICGANDYEIWKTPLTKVVSTNNNYCKFWPCCNRPKCSGMYQCISNIKVSDVMRAFNHLDKINVK